MLNTGFPQALLVALLPILYYIGWMEVVQVAGFSELIRSFDKVREYMRDFYVYGFKQRGDFAGPEGGKKSARTYDNEKRRIESYLGGYVRWSQDKNGKRTFISLDSAAIASNPLYAAWKSKSFTAKDIMLHFYILDALRDGAWRSIEEITDLVCLQSRRTFETQTARLKCAEYVGEGVLCSEKRGKTLYYALSEDQPDHSLLEAVKFFQEAAPFGEIGSFLLDNLRERNDLFRFKHHYIVHTLEDGVLLEILRAMREKCFIRCRGHGAKGGADSCLTMAPLKILRSAATGRRYVCGYNPARRRFMNQRLDHIKSLEFLEACPEYGAYHEALERNLPAVWGVSFGGPSSRRELLCMKLHIDERTEGYVLERLRREGRGGEILHMAENTYLYSRELSDTNEISSWIKTFVGRIIALEGTNRYVVEKFYSDMERMREMYAMEDRRLEEVH